MTRIRSRGLAPLTVLSTSIALLCAAPAQAETDLGELLVGDFDLLVLDNAGGPWVSQGASIGNPPHSTVLPPSSGELVLGEFAEWTNTGRFWVASHFGIQNTSGAVTLGANSLFNNTSTPNTFPELPNDVRIGQSGPGSVYVDPAAIWLNQGVPNQVSFTVGQQGFLDIQGELISDASSVIDGGNVLVYGSGARWQVGGFGLDIEGFGQAGELRVSDGGVVNDMGFAQVGFSSNSSGQLFVGNEPLLVAFGFDEDQDENGPVRSLFSAEFMEIGVFNNASGYVEVTEGGRIDVSRQLRLGRAGGTGTLVVNQDGEVLVGGFFATSLFGGQTVEIWSGGAIDLSGGGKVVIGGQTTPLDNPLDGTPNDFENIAAGTLLVNSGGTLKGTGVVIGDVLVMGSGQVLPGHSPGRLVIDGDLTLDGGSLVMEIAGTGTGQFDQLEVSGLLTLGGSLVLSFIDGFAPGLGESFELDLFDAVIAGAFADVQVEGLAAPLAFDFNALSSGAPVTFTVVPVPAAVWLFASALGLLGVARRRARA